MVFVLEPVVTDLDAEGIGARHVDDAGMGQVRREVEIGSAAHRNADGPVRIQIENAGIHDSCVVADLDRDTAQAVDRDVALVDDAVRQDSGRVFDEGDAAGVVAVDADRRQAIDEIVDRALDTEVAVAVHGDGRHVVNSDRAYPAGPAAVCPPAGGTHRASRRSLGTTRTA